MKMDRQISASRADHPSTAWIAVVLSEVTEVLACEFANPTTESPLWDDSHWRIARAAAAMQGISSLLFTRLLWKGPEDWRRFLESQSQHIARRQQRVAKLLEIIDRKAIHERIPVVALKGAALHRLGVYSAGERPMADVDLLVREADVNAMVRLLEECSYTLSFTNSRHRLFEPQVAKASSVVGLGEDAENPVKVELHTSIQEHLPLSEIDITEFVFPRSAQWGLNDYSSHATLLMHLLLHAAGNIRAHALRFVQLHDIAKLAARLDHGDWQELLEARPCEQGLWWAAAPLILTERYYPGTVPRAVIERFSLECPWLLRRRSRTQRITDVSWSNIKIYAFPGIEWARTPQEALKFVITRIWPTRENKMELKWFNENYPGAVKIPWYGISQSARVLRRVFGRPPRVQTLLPVLAALSQPESEAAGHAPIIR